MQPHCYIEQFGSLAPSAPSSPRCLRMSRSRDGCGDADSGELQCCNCCTTLSCCSAACRYCRDISPAVWHCGSWRRGDCTKHFRQVSTATRL